MRNTISCEAKDNDRKYGLRTAQRKHNVHHFCNGRESRIVVQLARSTKSVQRNEEKVWMYEQRVWQEEKETNSGRVPWLRKRQTRHTRK
jgi:hypothetical protein